MKNLNKDLQELRACYNKKLLDCHKQNFNSLNNNMEYFITYLKFLRDYFVLTEPFSKEDGTENLKLSAIIAAVSEYEKFQTCIFKYYKVGQAGIERLTDESEEEVMRKYGRERATHWGNFWQLVMLNMENWNINA